MTCQFPKWYYYLLSGIMSMWVSEDCNHVSLDALLKYNNCLRIILIMWFLGYKMLLWKISLFSSTAHRKEKTQNCNILMSQTEFWVQKTSGILIWTKWTFLTTTRIPVMLGHFFNLTKMKTLRISNHMGQYFIHIRT